jgi:hypothetical protein
MRQGGDEATTDLTLAVVASSVADSDVFRVHINPTIQYVGNNINAFNAQLASITAIPTVTPLKVVSKLLDPEIFEQLKKSPPNLIPHVLK